MISTIFCIRVQLNKFRDEYISQIVWRVYVTRKNFILLWNDYDDYLKVFSANEASSGKIVFWHPITRINQKLFNIIQSIPYSELLTVSHPIVVYRDQIIIWLELGSSRALMDVWLMYDSALIRRRTEVCTFPESCITTPTVFVEFTIWKLLVHLHKNVNRSFWNLNARLEKSFRSPSILGRL